MTSRNYTNTGATSTLVAAIGPTDTTMTLNNYAGDPTVPFTAALARGTTTEEIILVTAVNGTTVTVTRGWDGTNAQAQGSGATFQHVVVAQDFRDMQSALSQASTNATALSTHTAATAAHGTSGAVVGTTDTQTLSNKTLTAPVVNDPTIKAAGATVNFKWVQITQAAYTALATKAADTLYAIVG